MKIFVKNNTPAMVRLISYIKKEKYYTDSGEVRANILFEAIKNENFFSMNDVINK